MVWMEMPESLSETCSPSRVVLSVPQDLKDLRVLMVLQVLLDLTDSLDRLGLDRLANLDLPDPLETREHLEALVRLDNQDPLERLEREVSNLSVSLSLCLLVLRYLKLTL